MLKRQTTGSVVCVSCGYLVGVKDERCYNCNRRNPGLWGYASAVRRLGNDLGFVPFVIAICAVMFVVTLMRQPGGPQLGSGLFNLLPVDGYTLLEFGASGRAPVFLLHRWWTVLSAVWLHGSLIHILFNVMWIRQLAPAVGELYGPGRMVIIYTVAGIVGFVFSIVGGAQLTVGASGSIFGLLGALVHYGRRTGSSHITRQAMTWAVMCFVMGFVFAGVDNFAHAGGFVGGFLMAMVLDPLKPERVDHMVTALVCIVLSILSIAASIFVPIGFN